MDFPGNSTVGKLGRREITKNLGFRWGMVSRKDSEVSEQDSDVIQLCPSLSNPMDYRLPGSSIHGIFQARVLEWGAIAFSALAHRTVANVMKAEA